MPQGQTSPTAQPLQTGYYQTVPQVRTDRRYRIVPDVLPEGFAGGDGVYDVAADAIVSDAFCQQDFSSDGDSNNFAVRRGWSHRTKFNVLCGAGAVQTVTDDGTIADNSAPPGEQLDSDGWFNATRSERVWQFFDTKQ